MSRPTVPMIESVGGVATRRLPRTAAAASSLPRAPTVAAISNAVAVSTLMPVVVVVVVVVVVGGVVRGEGPQQRATRASNTTPNGTFQRPPTTTTRSYVMNTRKPGRNSRLIDRRNRKCWRRSIISVSVRAAIKGRQQLPRLVFSLLISLYFSEYEASSSKRRKFKPLCCVGLGGTTSFPKSYRCFLIWNNNCATETAGVCSRAQGTSVLSAGHGWVKAPAPLFVESTKKTKKVKKLPWPRVKCMQGNRIRLGFYCAGQTV
jgi:hypothetical protein